MKTRNLWHGLLLMMAMILFNTFPALAAAGAGHLDSVEGDSISGWAWNSEDPAANVDVTVTITNLSTGETVKELDTSTSIFRDDLDASVYGDGSHGFNVTVDWNELTPGIYSISAIAGNKKISNNLRYNNGNVDETTAARPIGSFKTTAYCPCRICSEGWGRNTSSGAQAVSDHTVAVDPRVIPIGSRLMINGVVYTAEDIGGGVRGNHIDIFFNTHAETRQYGTRSVEVLLLN